MLRRLYLFDVDDTLVISKSQVLVKVKGETLRLPTTRWRHFKAENPDAEVSYEEFMGVESLTEGEFGPAFSLFTYWCSRKYEDIDVGILTNRSTEPGVIFQGLTELCQKFNDSECHVNPNLIFATNSAFYYPLLKHMSPSEQKAEIVEAMIPEYSTIFFIDDDHANLAAVGKLHPKIITVDPHRYAKDYLAS